MSRAALPRHHARNDGRRRPRPGLTRPLLRAPGWLAAASLAGACVGVPAAPAATPVSKATVTTSASTSTSASASTPAASAAAVAPGPYVTLLFSRTEVGANDTPAPGCALDIRNIARLDTVVAPWLAARGMAATGTLQTGLVQPTAVSCLHFRRSVATSWATASALAQTYGWKFVSHSASYPKNFPALTPEQKQAETCGSIRTIQDHGLPGANGMFAYPDNHWTVEDQTTYVAPCFAFGRQYALKAGITTQDDARTAPYFQHTATISGGACNDPSLPCWSLTPLDGQKQRYDLPSVFTARIAGLRPGQWYTIQNYILVSGVNPAYRNNPIRWDCRGSDPNKHWTSDTEYYCWNDFQTIVRSIPAAVKVTDPLSVAQSFGRPGY